MIAPITTESLQATARPLTMERRLARAILGVAAFLLIAFTRADVDLWGHVVFGRDILTNGFTSTDPYSFTSDIPWVNHEWLAEVFFWWAWAGAGGFGLVFLKVVLVGGMLVCAWRVLRRSQLPPLAVEALFLILVFGTWPRTSVVRPQLFSVFLFAALLWILQSVELGYRRRVWWLPVVFVLWINLHGGWIVGFGILGLWAAMRLVGRSTRISAVELIAATAATVGALLVNPYGWRMLEFIATTVRIDRSDIVDWQPLWQSGFLTTLWLGSTALAGFVWWRHWRSVPFWQTAIVLCLALASVRVSRLDAFYAIAVAMLLGPHTGPKRPASELAVPWAPVPLFAGIVAAIGIIIAAATERPLWCVALDVGWAPERQAGEFLNANALEGRLLTWFDWGEYVIWHRGPNLKVSVDGRRETVYSAPFLQSHDQLYAHPDENLAMLTSLEADYAWLPAHLPLVRALDALGWVRIFAGEKSVMFARRPGTFVNVAAPVGFGCFPGP